MDRIILHSDLNNFYASVECLRNPAIRDKPVAVCGSQSTRHGIVLAKNYEARKYGVKTGEPVWEARAKCPGLVVVKPNLPLYLKFSAMAREVYEHYSNLVEPFGIDESWLDVTASTRLFGSGEKIAHEIRVRIKKELGITASVGVSFNKVFAKLASDMKKPDAVTVISREDFKEKLWGLPVEELLYVGPSTREKLNRLAIFTIGDLANASPALLNSQLGVWGQTLWLFANGCDDTPVRKAGYESVIKGIGNSLTTPRDLTCNEEAKALLYVLAESVGERLRKHGMAGRAVQITIRDSRLAFVQRQAKLPFYSCITSEIAGKAYDIFLKSWDWSQNIRLLGVRVTDLVELDVFTQLSLLPEEAARIRREMLERSVDRIREKFGYYSVQRALLLKRDPMWTQYLEGNTFFPRRI